MWSSLPSNLRNVLGIALVLGVGVALAAFALSFFALRSAAANPALQFGKGHEWMFPIGIDMGLLFCETLLIGASMVRTEDARGNLIQYNRAIPFMLVMIAAGGTLYFNATRVPAEVRPIALAVPVTSILVTFGLAYLLKMLAAVSGADVAHIAPPQMEPRRVVRRRDTVEGELTRMDTPPLETSSGPRSPARVQALAKSGYGAKRMKVTEYLEHQWRGESPAEVARATGTSERYCKQLMIELKKKWR